MAKQRVLVRVYRNPFRGLNPVRVWEDNPLGGNTGNLLFSDAAVRALCADDVDLTCWTTEQIAARVPRINESFDHLVLPLANAFRPQYLDQLAALTEILRRVEIPVTVLGIGVQASADYELPREPEVDEAATLFMRAVLERSGSVGVRGAFTAEYLADLGFGEEHVDVIGCPSMFEEGATVRAPREIPPGGPTQVSLNLTPTAPVDQQWLDTMIARFPELLYVPQDRRDLGLMLWDRAPTVIPRQFAGFPDHLDHPLFAERRAHLHLDPRAWLADLERSDLVIGTRIHGAICGTLAGAPSHLLVHDSRTRELAEHFEIPHSRIDGGRAHPDLDQVLAGDFGAPARGHTARFARFTGFLDAHHLPHVWRESATSTWEEAVGEPTPPIVVDHGRGPQATTLLRWVDEHRATQVAALERRLDKQEAKARGLRRENRELRRRLAKHTTRLDRLAARVQRSTAPPAPADAGTPAEDREAPTGPLGGVLRGLRRR